MDFYPPLNEAVSKMSLAPAAHHEAGHLLDCVTVLLKSLDVGPRQVSFIPPKAALKCAPNRQITDPTFTRPPSTAAPFP